MKFLIWFAVLYLIAIWVEGLDEEDFVRVVIPPNDKLFGLGSEIVPSEHHRATREKNTCKLPKSMDDAKMDCKLYPSKVTCIQSCIFGHTLSDGTQREMKCIYDEDIWKPSPIFEKCLPFVDCTLKISSGGKYKCVTNFMDKGPSCDISCEHFEDNPEVPLDTYECDIDGKWTPELPFCATPGGMKLVSLPPDLGPALEEF